MSILSISEMVAQINKNFFAKPYLYEVRIMGTDALTDADRDIMMNCSSVNVPGKNFQFVQDKRYGIGHVHNVPTGRSFTEVNMTFYESEYEREREYFSDWQNRIYDQQTKRFKFFRDYVKDVYIIQKDKKGNKTYECKLIDCYPSNLSPLDRSYSAEGITQFNVNLQFYEIEETFYDKKKGYNPFSFL